MTELLRPVSANGSLRRNRLEVLPALLVLHTQAEIRQGLRSVLERTRQFDRVDACTRSVEAVSRLIRRRYQLFLVEFCGEGMRFIKLAQESGVVLPILLVAGEVPAYEPLAASMCLGVKGCVDVSDTEDILRGVTHVLQGRDYLTPRWGVEFLKSGTRPRPTLRLSPRERQVLAALRRDLSLSQIAEELEVAPSTVKRHAIRLYRKLAVRDREQACQVAQELGLLPAP